MTFLFSTFIVGNIVVRSCPIFTLEHFRCYRCWSSGGEEADNVHQSRPNQHSANINHQQYHGGRGEGGSQINKYLHSGLGETCRNLSNSIFFIETFIYLKW